MLKDLSDFPKTVETFVGGLIAFLYRFAITAVGVFISPVYGALRAWCRPAERSISEQVMLFLSCALIAIVSVVTPDEVPGVVGKETTLLAEWLFYAISFFLLFDGLVLCAGAILHKRGRHRRRVWAILRYAIAGTVTAWFVSAALTLYGPGGPFGLAPHWTPNAALAVLLRAFRTSYVSDVIEGAPVIGTAWLIFAASRKRGPWRAATTAACLLVVLGAGAAVSHLKLPYILETAARGAAAKLKPNKAPAKFNFPEPPPGIRSGVAVCKVATNGAIDVTASLRNTGADAAVVDLTPLEVEIPAKGSNLLQPKFYNAPATAAEQPIAIVPGHGAVVFHVSAHLKGLEDVDLSSGCFVTSRDKHMPLAIMGTITTETPSSNRDARGAK